MENEGYEPIRSLATRSLHIKESGRLLADCFQFDCAYAQKQHSKPNPPHLSFFSCSLFLLFIISSIEVLPAAVLARLMYCLSSKTKYTHFADSILPGISGLWGLGTGSQGPASIMEAKKTVLQMLTPNSKVNRV